MDKSFPTAEQLRRLADRLRASEIEACQNGQCDCITVEEHQQRLAGN